MTNNIRYRVKITGTYRGNPFEYVDPPDSEGSQFFYPEDNEPGTSYFWWTGGNFGCDCNRSKFLPEKWNVPDDCGDEILIDKIEPIDTDYPSLELNETVKGKDY